MLELMTGPITQGSIAGDAVVGQGAAPHNLRSCIVIIRLLEGDFSIAHYVAQQCCSNIINQGQLLSLLAGKVTL